VTVDDIKSRLHDAGANLSALQFTGSAQCAILIGDAKETDIEAAPELPAIANAPTNQPPPQQPAIEQPAVEQPAPAPAAPVAPAAIVEEQLIVTRPLSRGQRFIASDIEIKRVQLDDPAAATATQPAITKEQILGNVASRELKRGDVLTAADMKRPAVVTKDQFMTVALRVGQFDVETVARALDSAAIGEIVRAKNEANGDVYRVVVTAANEGRVAGEEGTNVATLNPQP
jgi:flagella basal body P-ring formation protein FlgA